MEDRNEHLKWCKQRALEYVDQGALPNALASMMSDMGKHPETAMNPMLARIGLMEIERGPEAVRNWINGFN